MGKYWKRKNTRFATIGASSHNRAMMRSRVRVWSFEGESAEYPKLAESYFSLMEAARLTSSKNWRERERERQYTWWLCIFLIGKLHRHPMGLPIKKKEAPNGSSIHDLTLNPIIMRGGRANWAVAHWYLILCTRRKQKCWWLWKYVPISAANIRIL